MPVTELALLRLKEQPTSTHSSDNPSHPSAVSPAILNSLHHAASQQATFSKFPVAILQCHEEPSHIYLIGGWDSVQTHMDEWIPGPINQELLGMLGKDIDVLWMFHLDVEPARVHSVLRLSESGNDDDAGAGVGEGVVAIGRHFVANREKGRVSFTETWEGNVVELDGFTRGGRKGREGGWRADRGFEAAIDTTTAGADSTSNSSSREEGGIGSKTEKPDEFVLFTAWGRVQDHLDFGNSEAFQRYGRIREHLSGAEVRHGKVLFVAEP